MWWWGGAESCLSTSTAYRPQVHTTHPHNHIYSKQKTTTKTILKPNNSIDMHKHDQLNAKRYTLDPVKYLTRMQIAGKLPKVSQSQAIEG